MEGTLVEEQYFTAFINFSHVHSEYKTQILQNVNKLKTVQNTKYPKKFRCTLFRLQPQKEEKMKWPIDSWS